MLVRMRGKKVEDVESHSVILAFWLMVVDVRLLCPSSYLFFLFERYWSCGVAMLVSVTSVCSWESSAYHRVKPERMFRRLGGL